MTLARSFRAKLHAPRSMPQAPCSSARGRRSLFHRALIPSLLLTFDLSPATARAKPALWFVLRIDCEVDLHAGL
jgi:hypothetical protein